MCHKSITVGYQALQTSEQRPAQHILVMTILKGPHQKDIYTEKHKGHFKNILRIIHSGSDLFSLDTNFFKSIY